MYLPTFMRRKLFKMVHPVTSKRPPDLVINNGYLLRWHIYRNQKIGCIYLHLIAGDDDDRALHDHPWWNASIILQGSYYEWLPGGYAIQRNAGSVICRRPESLHRLELGDHKDMVWSLFVTGPKVRTWGFQTENGWVPHREFLGITEDRL